MAFGLGALGAPVYFLMRLIFLDHICVTTLKPHVDPYFFSGRQARRLKDQDFYDPEQVMTVSNDKFLSSSD